MFYSGGTPELFACNKINRKEKDRRILNTKIIYRVDTYTGEGRFDIKLTKNPGSDYRCICAFNASYESQADNNISSLNYFYGDPVAFFIAQFTTSQKMQIGTVWMKK